MKLNTFLGALHCSRFQFTGDGVFTRVVVRRAWPHFAEAR